MTNITQEGVKGGETPWIISAKSVSRSLLGSMYGVVIWIHQLALDLHCLT